jgi:hypothetical protein
MNSKALISLLVLIFLSTGTYAQRRKKQEPIVISKIKFGEIKINKKTYEKDVVIDKGEIRKRDKGPSKPYKGKGHTPLTEFEEIPWDCKILVIGKGMSKRLPITDGFKEEAKKRGVELIILETPEAVKYINENYSEDMNAIIHITC